MAQVAETTSEITLPEFFAVVAPGFEMLAANELLTYLPDTEIEVTHGGILFQAPLAEGCELNRVLKIPTRILLRLTSFTCRDFPKLFRKTSVFPWEQWIPNGAEAEFQASAQGSRVSIKKRIEETCIEGFKKRTKNRVAKPAFALTVFVRLDDDICTISIDTSGEILHKRGTRTLTSDAPIRETIAAALLFEMVSKDKRSEAGGVTLVDPMFGSGTFFLEAAQLTDAVTTREFAFSKFPRYQKEAGVGLSGALQSKLRNPFSKFVGLELDTKAMQTTTGNLKPLIGSREIQAVQGDIFKAEPLAGSDPRWLIANPPYGERLKIEGPLSEYYESLFEACERFAAPLRACIIVPITAKPASLKAPRAWKLRDSLRFENGGIPVVALHFTRR